MVGLKDWTGGLGARRRYNSIYFLIAAAFAGTQDVVFEQFNDPTSLVGGFMGLISEEVSGITMLAEANCVSFSSLFLCIERARGIGKGLGVSYK